MCWSEWMAVEKPKKLPSWAVTRHLWSLSASSSNVLLYGESHRVRCRPQAVESVAALFIGDELPAQVVFGLIRILLLV